MTDVASTTASIVYVYRNGDINFPGKKIVINRRKIRDLEALFEEFRERTNCRSAVRRICTPLGKHNVSAIDKLEPGGKYVVIGRGKFQKLNYGELPDRKSNLPKFSKLDEPIKNKLIVPGRVMEAYEGERIALRVVYIHRNGDDRNLPHKILLKKGMLKDMEQVLSFIQERITFYAAIGGLYSLEGRRIDEPAEIRSSGTYVAVERGRKFKRVPYCGSTTYAPFQRSAPVRLPPIQQQSLKRKLKVRSYPNSKNSWQESPSIAGEGPGDNSRVTSTTLGLCSPRDLAHSPDELTYVKGSEETEAKVKPEMEYKSSVIKQTAAFSQRKKTEQARRQPKTNRKSRAKSREEPKPEKLRTSPATSPVLMEKKNGKHAGKQETHTKTTPKPNTQKNPTPPSQSPPSKPKPKVVGGKVKRVKAAHTRAQAPLQTKLKPKVLLHDEEDVVAVEVFKASGIQREKGKQVAESRGVVADMPIDMLPAEEVTEEITESVENILWNSGTPRESTVPADEELNEVERIGVGSKYHLSDEEPEFDSEATGSHAGKAPESPKQSPASTASPAPVGCTTEKNEEDENYGSPSLLLNKNGDEEREEENTNEGKSGTSDSKSESAQLERPESHNGTLEEPQSQAIETERGEKKHEEDTVAPIALEQLDGNQKAENQNNDDPPMEIESNNKDAAKDGGGRDNDDGFGDNNDGGDDNDDSGDSDDGGRDNDEGGGDNDNDINAGKEENSDPEPDEESDNGLQTDTVDDAATYPEITSPSGSNPTETKDAAATGGPNKQDDNGEGRSSQTERKIKYSDVDRSKTTNGETEKDSYFS